MRVINAPCLLEILSLVVASGCTITTAPGDSTSSETDDTTSESSTNAGGTGDSDSTDTSTSTSANDSTDDAVSTDTEADAGVSPGDESTEPDASDPAVDPGIGVVLGADGGTTGDADLGTEADDGAVPDVVSPERMGCGEGSLEDATIINSKIGANTTLSGTVVIDGHITTSSIELTIEPGTHLVFKSDSSLKLGTYTSDAATLKAEGTEDQPIVLCGEEATAGFWGSLSVEVGTKSNSTMSHVAIFDGGGDGSNAALILTTDILVEHVSVANSATAGIRATAFDDDSTDLNVTSSAKAAILTTSAAVHNFPQGGDLRGNTDDRVHLTFSTVDSDTTFANLGIPYLQEESMTVDTNSVTFEAGVVYQFEADMTWRATKYTSGKTTVKVEGTESAPVIFEGLEATPGFWGGMELTSSVLTNSKLEHMIVRNAGDSETFALSIDTPLTVDHVVVEDSDYGVFIGSSGLDTQSSTLSVTGISKGTPVVLKANALDDIPTGGRFSDNENNWVRVDPGSFGGRRPVPNLGIPYLLNGNVLLADGAVFAPEPGTHFLMQADSTFIATQYSSDAAELQLVGTEEAPIVFSGAEETAGFWRGIEVRESVLTASKMEWVEVAHAGGGDSGTAALYLNIDLDVSNCTFRDSAGAGIKKKSSNGIDYTANNTFTDLAGEDVITN